MLAGGVDAGAWVGDEALRGADIDDGAAAAGAHGG